MHDGWWLIGDLGASHCRLAASTGPGEATAVRVYPTAGTPTFEQTLTRYLAEAGLAGASCRGGCIAAAGPVEDGEVTLTNAPWTIRTATVSALLYDAPVRLFNDLAAVALLLPHLQAADATLLWPSSETTSLTAPRLAVNVGTGFGAAAAVPVGDAYAVVSGEPGHMALVDPSFGVETVEDALSGAGVLRLYRRRGGASAQTSSAVLASTATDPVAKTVADDLAQLMGRVAGDLALALGAWGGVYFTGSVALALLDVADHGLIRAAFEAKGAMRARMQRVPVHRLTTVEPALLGLSYVTR